MKEFNAKEKMESNKVSHAIHPSFVTDYVLSFQKSHTSCLKGGTKCCVHRAAELLSTCYCLLNTYFDDSLTNVIFDRLVNEIKLAERTYNEKSGEV